MRPIASHPGLRRLDLGDAELCGLDDEMLAPLAGNTTITWLTIHSVNVTDEGLASLSSMRALEVLDIQYAKMTAGGLRPLIAKNQIRDLNTPLRLTAADCAELANMTSLRSLEAYDVETAGVDSLATLPALQRFTLRGPLTTRLTDDALRRFPKHVQVFHEHIQLFGPGSEE